MATVSYFQVVGSLMYVMVCIRPEIAHVMEVVNRYMAKLGSAHWELVKWLLRYLKDTSSMSLCFKIGSMNLEDFVDVDINGDLDSRNSSFGYVFMWGYYYKLDVEIAKMCGTFQIKSKVCCNFRAWKKYVVAT